MVCVVVAAAVVNEKHCQPGGALLGINHPKFFVICSSCCHCSRRRFVVVSLLLLAKDTA